MKPLLILVDLQYDFLKSPDLDPPAQVVVQGAATLLARCRERGMPVAHVWTTVSREPDNRMPHWKQANIWRCEEGTPGHQPPAPLAPLEGEPVFHKTGLSAFDPPTLTDLARRLAIDTAIVAGVKTHACVRQMALDAWQAGLAVWIATDAIASDDPLHAVITRRFLEARGIEFVSPTDLTARLDGGGASIAASDKATSAVLVTAARKLAETWRETSIEDRASLVHRLIEVLTAEGDQLAVLMATEIGKPLRFGRAEVRHCLEMLERIVRRAERADDAVDGHAVGVVRRRPHGVIAAITPWNNPLYIALGKVVPAMVYGNTVVWKPAPEALMVSRRLFQCFAQANWPEGLVNLLEGGEREAETLMNEDCIGAVTITGSSAAGYTAQEICARRRLALQAELGGNNAAIVWPDANLQAAARMVAAGAFAMAGQRCTANRRVILHDACRDEFMRLLLQESAALKWGDPLQDDTDIGPLVSMPHRARVASAVGRATSECGAPLLPLGDEPPNVKGYAGKFYPPVILCCDAPAREIVQEETFGPVLVVQVAQSWDHAVRLCNGVRQGLAASVFTTSHEIVRNFLDEAEAGILKVNQSTAGAAVDVPFGGWKASRVGAPEHGSFDLEFFTRPQTVYGQA
jgi:acyl-CoA reductase-like NAD-dependent aldehyde dehydrogenase